MEVQGRGMSVVARRCRVQRPNNGNTPAVFGRSDRERLW